MIEALYGIGDSGSLIGFVIWAIGVVTALTVCAFLYLMWHRLRWERESGLVAAVEADWTPVFNAMRRPVPVSMPVVSKQEAPALLALWLEQRQLANDRFADALDALALEKGLNQTICALLKIRPLGFAPSARWISIAIRAARWIDTPDTRRALINMIESDSPAFAIAACESLLEIRHPDSVRLSVTLLFRYPEFDKTITTRLGNAGGAEIIRALDPFIERLPPNRLEDMIYLIERSGDESLLPILLRRLSSPGSDEEIASLLRAIANIGNPSLRDLVVPFLDSPVSFIRVQACRAMATVGSRDDVPMLVEHLSDAEWWVRFRTAESITALVGDDDAALDLIAKDLDDPYALDVLHHARQERDWLTK